MMAAQLAGGARAFGATGLVVSRMGYGAMELSGAPRARDLSEAFVARFLEELVDRGVNYIDTSIDYGLSEILIGKSLAHRRGDFILASKCACEVGVEHPARGENHTYTGANVVAGVEQSLRRMKTDHLDVVQVHGDPTRRELEEGGVDEALRSLKQRGLIRFSGLSSRLPKLAEFVDVDWLDVIQVPWSALQRTNEDVIAALKRSGKAIVARGVAGRGAPAKDWATRPIGTAQGEVQGVWERAKLDDLLGGLSRMEFMIRFALANADIDVALVATTDMAHLADDVEIANRGRLPAEVYEAAKARLMAAGTVPGQGAYVGGGPSIVV